MDPALAICTLRKVISLGNYSSPFKVYFIGGEPLLHFQAIREVVDWCKSDPDASNVNFSFALNTNAIPLTDDRADFLVQNGFNIAVSVDGSRRKSTSRHVPGTYAWFNQLQKTQSRSSLHVIQTTVSFLPE